jgi:hypothetical protein
MTDVQGHGTLTTRLIGDIDGIARSFRPSTPRKRAGRCSTRASTASFRITQSIGAPASLPGPVELTAQVRHAPRRCQE